MLFLQVLQGLEIASICVEDMDEWLGIFNIKLRHMREDIQSVCLLFTFTNVYVQIIFLLWLKSFSLLVPDTFETNSRVVQGKEANKSLMKQYLNCSSQAYSL